MKNDKCWTMVICLFRYELHINGFLVNTKTKLYCIRAGTVGYYSIGQIVKGDCWYQAKQYAMRYCRKEAKKQLKMLRHLLRKEKSMSIYLEEA